MTNADAPLVFLSVEVWELRSKWHRFHISGTRKGPIHPKAIVAFTAAVGWELLPVTSSHAAANLLHPLD